MRGRGRRKGKRGVFLKVGRKARGGDGGDGGGGDVADAAVVNVHGLCE